MKMKDTNRKILNLILLTVVLIFSSNFISAQEITKSLNYETSCENEVCTTMIYSYEKYFLRNNVWEEIDEDFFDCSANGETKFCTNNYRFNVVAKGNGEVSAFRNGEEDRFKLMDFRNNSLRFSPVLRDGMLVYEDVIPGYIDIEYKFYPDKLKENIVVKQPLPNLERDFNIKFSKIGANFIMRDFIICDSKDVCIRTEHSEKGNDVSVRIPSWFLNHENVTYPVYIDPSIELNDSFILWNGFVTNGTNDTYTRTNNPNANIKLGNFLTFILIGNTTTTIEEHANGNIEWNVSSIPDGSKVYNITLSVFTATSDGGSQNATINVTHMEKTSSHYEDNETYCYGNCHFYKDMSNGTIYKSSSIITQQRINLSLSNTANTKLENSLSSDIFGTGLIGKYSTTNELWVKSRDVSNADKRPVLIVTYGVNSADANLAIAEGINNSLPNNLIESAQQIYLVNENGQHYTGTFDKTTIFGNQTWVFNYIVGNDIFTNMPSLFRVLNVWENQALSYEEIVNQVETFINNTRY